MFQKEQTLNFLEELLIINSPTGYTKDAIDFLRESIEELGFKTTTTPKGNLMVKVEGQDSTITRGLSAHVDTLGLMVRSINADGTLALTKLGGPLTPTLDGEYCEIITRDGQLYTGTILSKSPSIHVFKDAATKDRDIDSLMVKIDERVESKEDVQKLGIQNGDIIAYEPKVMITESGFIKSRFLDDKASVSVLVSILTWIKENNVTPTTNLTFIFSTYEEVGHGAAWIPENITELLAVDMGCIGDDLDCDEYDVSICVKDSSGPYDYDLTTKLANYAKQKELNYALDIYPMYGSDASAALGGGANIRAALIGPGVSSSHGMERTHVDALENTFKLIQGYVSSF
ncbi:MULTISPECIES: M42 family metallopeptidase [Aerococcaceae]|uniref:Aminopeptidase n=3 Tax=Aerococcaceae TaxID=186827 RepID=A0AAU8U4N6_9LACT|nr:MULTISPECIES: M42 family metallopeptidase [Aerococcaceae]AMC00928.1 aminopeptidase [Aerococcus viridans]EFG48725.1 M42 glutamyl aminopeptidase [Aerococcus viridans ATCC 11563 = CCUG 4311]MBG9979225.1 M42 family metallopeptidase [Ruoffia tabacinasalis]SUU04895.1 Putative aminopeptidase ysdC [Aerococcus viridans]GMR70879.1 M42 family metallopeptidase [Aerococcus viridans]